MTLSAIWTGQSKLQWYMARSEARKYMFYLLYFTESMDEKNSYCLITSTNYFINQQMLNIKGLKKKHL